MNAPPDLTNHPPRSPRERVGGFDILGRAIDKCRAVLTGKIGDYHFDCPLDKRLFEFLGVGANDEQIVTWFSKADAGKRPRSWSSGMRRSKGSALSKIPTRASGSSSNACLSNSIRRRPRCSICWKPTIAPA